MEAHIILGLESTQNLCKRKIPEKIIVIIEYLCKKMEENLCLQYLKLLSNLCILWLLLRH